MFEQTITGGKVAQTYTVNLLKTSQLTFQAEKVVDEETSHTYIFDAWLS